jgi:multiple sugar transport system permease protein
MSHLLALKLRDFFQKDSTIAYLFIAPVVAIVLGLIAYPFFNAIWLSLCRKWVGYPPKFIGLGNYIKLFYDSFFRMTVRNSFIYTFGAVSLKLAIGMVMALTLNEAIRFRNFFRGILLVPWVAPKVVTALTWLWLYDSLKGAINLVLAKTGLIAEPIGWLSHPHLALFAVMSVNIWRGFAFFGVCLLAGMQGIPRELYEAAEVDGASRLSRFLYITLPALKPIIIVTTLLSTIWTFNDFDLVYIMTRGGPGGATQIFPTLTYEIGFEGLNWGEGTAVSLYLLPILVVVIVLLSGYLRRS